MIRKPDQPVLAIITSHWLSVIGAGIVTTAAICWMLALPAQVRGHVSNPYIGILLFVVLPIVFVAGLVLIPVGLYLARRKVRAGLADTVVDRPTSIRRLATFLAVTTLFNIIIGSQLTYRAVEHMETVQFCGASCHVMKPQFTAYQNAAHSRVLCVDCHVAPGASGWVASKVAGTRQLLAVAMDNYPRPVEPALLSGRLAPSSVTCEQCHFPQAASAAKLRLITNYKDDEQNTATQTVLMMKIGGSSTTGIHGSHLGPGVRIRYVAADKKRETIPWVEYRNEKNGTVRTYVTADHKLGDVEKLETHDMQCVDCHNRPAHTFELPDRALNRALASGEIASSLPFVKKRGLELLKAEYRTQDEAAQKIVEGLRNYYRTSYPALFPQRANEIEQAGKAVSAIYARNVFPDLKVTWGSYPNNLGHTDVTGCFRCHDESHSTADKKVISQDCASCHGMLAVDEPAPEVLKTLNLADQVGQLLRR